MADVRVLLVEDDEAYAQLVERALSAVDVKFDIQTVSRLTDALQALHQRSFNLVLLDLNLPDISGLDTLDAIHSTNPMMPIVVLLEEDDAATESQAVKRGAQHCLNKSNLDKQTLIDAMQKAIRRRLQTPVKPPPKVDSMLDDLQASVTASKQALAVLDNQRFDPPAQDAIQTLRSHIGKMQRRITAFRRDAQ